MDESDTRLGESLVRHRFTVVRLRYLPLVAFLVLGAAGCGGGSKTYDVDASRACLAAKYKVTDVPSSDLVASAAEGGAFQVRLRSDQRPIVSFGDDRKGAERIVRAYQHFNIDKIALEDALKVRNNAVVLFTSHPSDDDISKIEGCLK